MFLLVIYQSKAAFTPRSAAEKRRSYYRNDRNLSGCKLRSQHGAGDGNRTRITGLGSRRSATELHLHLFRISQKNRRLYLTYIWNWFIITEKRSIQLSFPRYTKWSWWWGSNPRPVDYESTALPLSHTSEHLILYHRNPCLSMQNPKKNRRKTIFLWTLHHRP